MGRTFRTKTTVKECLCLTIADLTKKYKVLKENAFTVKHIEWTSRGESTGSISYTIDTTNSDYCFIKLNYTNTNYRTGEKTPMDYKIELVRVKSNLPGNKGFRWYFVCPLTFKLCTRLISIGKYFRSRDNKQVYYDIQTKSKKQRLLEPAYFYNLDQIEQERNNFSSGVFRSYYNGKPTKRFIRLENKERKANYSSQFIWQEFERLSNSFSF